MELNFIWKFNKIKLYSVRWETGFERVFPLLSELQWFDGSGFNEAEGPEEGMHCQIGPAK
jgi:N-acetylglutamate synthase-like GNAT family acetyltransferase